MTQLLVLQRPEDRNLPMSLWIDPHAVRVVETYAGRPPEQYPKQTFTPYGGAAYGKTVEESVENLPPDVRPLFHDMLDEARDP